MATLLDLPPECIDQIISLLPTRYVQSLAQTFNAQILLRCLPVLMSVIEKARNKRRMQSIFGKVCPEKVHSDDYDGMNLRAEYSPPDDPSEHLDFLNLSGDLRWLLPLEGEQASTIPVVWLASGSTVRSRDIESLRGQMRQLHIDKAVPEVFWKLVASRIPQRSIPAYNPTMWGNARFGPASYFKLGRLYRISVEVIRRLEHQATLKAEPAEKCNLDDNASEARHYVFAFYSTCRGRGIYYLYLNTDGGHCILRQNNAYTRHAQRGEGKIEMIDEANSRERLPIETELGITDMSYAKAEGLVLQATDFESWLVNLNYTERSKPYFWDEFLREAERPWAAVVYQDLLCFLQHVYTKEGRESQLA